MMEEYSNNIQEKEDRPFSSANGDYKMTKIELMLANRVLLVGFKNDIIRVLKIRKYCNLEIGVLFQKQSL